MTFHHGDDAKVETEKPGQKPAHRSGIDQPESGGPVSTDTATDAQVPDPTAVPAQTRTETSTSTETSTTAATPVVVPVVDPATGAVVGTAHVDPETGVATIDQPDKVTIVKRPAPHSSSSAGPVVAPTGGTTATERTSDTQAPVPPVAPPGEPTAVFGALDPSSFDFRAQPPRDWQETMCVPVTFAYLTPFGPARTYKVGVKVGVPTKLANGDVITSLDAQIASYAAAQAAGQTVVEMLKSGQLGAVAALIQLRFTGYMGGQLQLLGVGYRVTGCVPS